MKTILSLAIAFFLPLNSFAAKPIFSDIGSLVGTYEGNVAGDFDAFPNCTVEIKKSLFGTYTVTIQIDGGITFLDQTNPEGATVVPSVEAEFTYLGTKVQGDKRSFSAWRSEWNLNMTRDQWVASFLYMGERGAMVQLSYNRDIPFSFNGSQMSYQAQCGQLVRK